MTELEIQEVLRGPGTSKEKAARLLGVTIKQLEEIERGAGFELTVEAERCH